MNKNIWLRRFSKITCLSTLFLIFAGGMVTSTGSGLAVPDWPLSYGTLFPPMVGGVFYEHGHRMIASTVGLLMLILAIWLAVKEDRAWLKLVGYFALGAVIAQGILGGITVLYFLPTPISVCHGILAQTFFLMTIFIAYALSEERHMRSFGKFGHDGVVQGSCIALVVAVYIQLILGAIMRHTGSGLAIYDFPTIAGGWWPEFDQSLLSKINGWRFDNDFDPVNMVNIVYHFLHRLWAGVVVIVVCFLNYTGLKCKLPNKKKITQTILIIDALIALQIALGIATVLTFKSPIITSFHVMVGAATLGVSFLALLRVSPLKIGQFQGS